MPIKETSYCETKKKAKIFTGGKPKDFTLVTDGTGSTVKGSIGVGASDKTYNITTANNFNAKDMREFADLLTELADIVDGKIAA